ncbi:MAG: hypothetical protein K0V04_09625 [Deltaproteobacteria bacterium]|nr:hypothetical protein [Deltaproteobacteria bacterium]
MGPRRVFAPWAEAPLAYICVSLAVATLVWKTVGLDFIPGWEDMFGGVGAQYPRRVVPMSRAWGLAYLLVYGCLGTAATVAGVLVTRYRTDLHSPAGPLVSRCAKIHGLFHVVLGCHHTLWAATGGAWGHLTLEQFDLPGFYIVGGIGGLGAGLHGLRLLLSSSADPTLRIVRSKIAVDGVSFLTFISVVVLFPMNALGMQRVPELERISWALVFIGPVSWLAADLLISRSPRSAGEVR